jgi:hypothetical protein
MKLIQLIVIGAADNYPNTPLLALDIKANPTPEKKDSSAVGLSLMYIIIILVNDPNKIHGFVFGATTPKDALRQR